MGSAEAMWRYSSWMTIADIGIDRVNRSDRAEDGPYPSRSEVSAATA